MCQAASVQIPALPLTRNVTLGELLKLSMADIIASLSDLPSVTTTSQVHFYLWGADFIIPLAWNDFLFTSFP